MFLPKNELSHILKPKKKEKNKEIFLDKLIATPRGAKTTPRPLIFLSMTTPGMEVKFESK